MNNRDRYTEHRLGYRTTRLPDVRDEPTNSMREHARTLWRKFGVLIVWPDQNIGGWPEQATRDNIGRRLYGERDR